MISVIETAPEKSTIIDWYAEFKRGRTNTDDAERFGRPKSPVVPKKITKFHKIVLDDRKLKLREIVDTLKISECSVFTILHEFLGMRKFFSKWVPRLLTLEQKQQRFEDPECCLELFKRGKKNFLRQCVTMNETWIHHYMSETKRSSAEWRAAGESCLKRPKTQQSAGKVMASVFWNAHGILFIDYFKKGKTINRDYYVALLNRFSAEIKKKRPHMQKKKVLFHQDNVPCNKSMKTMVKLNELSFDLLPHLPYSPDLAYNDYWLLTDLKKILQGKRFGSNEEVIAETEAYFESKDESFYKKGIEKLEKRWNECIITY